MLLFIGLIAGTVGSLVGLGGGIIIVPLLIGLHSLSPQLAVGTSMVTVVFTGLSSTLTYMKHKTSRLQKWTYFIYREWPWWYYRLMGK